MESKSSLLQFKHLLILLLKINKINKNIKHIKNENEIKIKGH